MPSTLVPPSIAAVVLAAGGSARMGRPKQLLPVRGQPMVRLVTEAACAAGLAQVVVVTGAAAEQVREAVSGLPVRVVYNADWQQGISRSLRAGIGALDATIGAALVILADHPGLSAGLIRRLAECYLETGSAIVAPVYRGRQGHPVLFDRRHFSDLAGLQGDRGARSLLDRPGAGVTYLDVDDPAVVHDVDTREEYSAAGGTDTGDGD